jgi:hypothetical protein
VDVSAMLLQFFTSVASGDAPTTRLKSVLR